MIDIPYHRRYNWFLVCRDYRIIRKVKLLALALLVGLVVYFGEWLMHEMIGRLDAEHANASLKADILYVASFGSVTQTDYIEGTVNYETRKPRKGEK